MGIIKFYPKDAADNPDNVLEQAIGKYESLLILGFDMDGDLDARASTNLNTGEILILIEKFKAKLINGDYCE
jgi:hypothetical protein